MRRASGPIKVVDEATSMESVVVLVFDIIIFVYFIYIYFAMLSYLQQRMTKQPTSLLVEHNGSVVHIFTSMGFYKKVIFLPPCCVLFLLLFLFRAICGHYSPLLSLGTLNTFYGYRVRNYCSPLAGNFVGLLVGRSYCLDDCYLLLFIHSTLCGHLHWTKMLKPCCGITHICKKQLRKKDCAIFYMQGFTK